MTTTDEFLSKVEWSSNYESFTDNEIQNFMIEFARIHVNRAIEKAATFAESYKCEQKILNCYPIELIK